MPSRVGPSRASALPLLAVIVPVLGTASLGGCTASPPASHPPTDVVSMTIRSALLDRGMPALVFRPRGYAPGRSYPVLYVMHGYGAAASAWFDGVAGDGIHLDGIAQSLIDAGRICPVVIASVTIANSYGVDSSPARDQFDHGPYERYLMTEAIPAVEAIYRPANGARGRFIAGLSMGGFAALHTGLGRPEAFAGVGALSPAIFVSTPVDRQWLFAGDPEANDPMRLVESSEVDGLRFFLGDGDADYGWIREGTRELAKRLSRRGIDIEPLIVPGGHDAGTWRQLAGPMLETLLAPLC